MHRGGIGGTQKVLIYGASGAVGTAAVQLARHYGGEVTGVCGPANLGLVQSLGADTVIDYTTDDFTRTGERYDRIFVAVGNRVHPPSRADCRTALAPDGAYVSVDEGRPKLRAEDLLLLKRLAEQGELKPVIDRRFPLEQMAEAHRYVESGHKRGNVIVTVTRRRRGSGRRHRPTWPGPPVRSRSSTPCAPRTAAATPHVGPGA